MRVETKSIRALQKHQRMIERSLSDFKDGRNSGHLAPIELIEVIRGLERRLSAVKQSLGANVLATDDRQPKQLPEVVGVDH